MYLISAVSIHTRQSSPHFGTNSPWADTIHIDTLARPFIAERLRNLQHSPFRCSIGRDVEICDVRDDRGNVDDLAGSIEFEQLPAEFLTSDICRFQIDVQDLAT